MTDHRALQWLYKTKDANDRLYCWFLKLAHDGYDYTVTHRAGKDHGNTDGVSRLLCKWDQVDSILCCWDGEVEATYTTTETIKSDLVPPKTVAAHKLKYTKGHKLSGGRIRIKNTTRLVNSGEKINETIETAPHSIVEQQKQCCEIALLRRFVEEGVIPNDKYLKSVIASEGRNLIIQDDILYHIANPLTSAKGLPRLQLVIPSSRREEVLTAAHDALFGGGHLGMEKTYNKVLERWWWPGVWRDTKHKIESCITCGQMHRGAATSLGQLQSIIVSEP